MKLNFLILVAAATAALGLAADSGVATITAKIPFAFESRGMKMPSGTYIVVRSDRGTSMTVRNKETGRSFVVTSNVTRANRVGGTWVEFKRYGDVYFLSAVSYGANEVAAEIPVAKREKEMALTMTPETVFARAD